MRQARTTEDRRANQGFVVKTSFKGLRISVLTLLVLAAMMALLPGRGLAITVSRDNLDEGCMSIAAVTGSIPRTWTDENGDHCSTDSLNGEQRQVDCQNGNCIGAGPAIGKREFFSLCKHYDGAYSNLPNGYKCDHRNADGTTWSVACVDGWCEGTTRKL